MLISCPRKLCCDKGPFTFASLRHGRCPGSFFLAPCAAPEQILMAFRWRRCTGMFLYMQLSSLHPARLLLIGTVCSCSWSYFNSFRLSLLSSVSLGSTEMYTTVFQPTLKSFYMQLVPKKIPEFPSLSWGLFFSFAWVLSCQWSGTWIPLIILPWCTRDFVSPKWTEKWWSETSHLSQDLFDLMDGRELEGS